MSDQIERLRALVLGALEFKVHPADRLARATDAVDVLGKLEREVERLRYIETCAQRLAAVRDEPGELLYREEEQLFQALKAPAPSALVSALRRAQDANASFLDRLTAMRTPAEQQANSAPTSEAGGFIAPVMLTGSAAARGPTLKEALDGATASWRDAYTYRPRFFGFDRSEPQAEVRARAAIERWRAVGVAAGALVDVVQRRHDCNSDPCPICRATGLVDQTLEKARASE